MVVPVTPVPGLDGDYIFHKQGLVTELNRNKPSAAYCSGIQILNPFRINELIAPSEDFYLTWNELIKKSALYCSEIYPDRWFTIDTVEQLNSLNTQG